MTQQNNNDLTKDIGLKQFEWWVFGLIAAFHILNSVLATLYVSGISTLFNIGWLLSAGLALYLALKKQGIIPRILLVLLASVQLHGLISINHYPGELAFFGLGLLGEVIFTVLVLRSAIQYKRLDLGILGISYLSSFALMFCYTPFTYKIPVLIETAVLAYILIYRKNIPKIILYPLIYLFILNLAEVLSMPLVAISMSFSDGFLGLW